MVVVKTLTRYFRIGGCLRTHRLLFEYAQGELAPDTRRKLDAHLRDCPGCRKFVESYRRTIAATRRFYPHSVEMPPELRGKLQQFIATNL
jgi:anti-sigma factor RsiW